MKDNLYVVDNVPFKEDKKSNSAALNDLLDEAIIVLGISEVSDYRQQIRDAHAAIAASRSKIADDQRARVSAPRERDQSRLDKVNPFSMSKEAIDESIANEKAEIKRQQERLVRLKETFAKELSKIGVEVDQEGVEALLRLFFLAHRGPHVGVDDIGALGGLERVVGENRCRA